MRKTVVSLVIALLAAGAALADTIYLKNGRQREGTFLGYENGEFIFELSNGKRVQFAADRVARLVIDRDETGRARREGGAIEDREGSIFSRRVESARWETADSFDVRPQDRWISSEIQVSRGQQVRVQASGTVTLDGWTTVGPDGLSGQRDRNAPMPNENDGALVAAIGQSYDSPSILIGRSREFTADRDGILYFAVNHSRVENSRGSFRVTVSVNRAGSAPAPEPQARAAQREKTVTVYANQPWTDTGIDIEPDMTIDVEAEGQIAFGVGRYAGPDGNRSANLGTSVYPVQDAGVGALIAKIRYRDGSDSNILFIGSRRRTYTEPNEYGRLYIGVNDDNFRDNSGSYRVTIRW